jgi:hypothetical protein
MALWGKSDNLASTPKYIARIAAFNSAAAPTGAVDATANTINILNSGTGFSTGDAVLYTINVGGTAIGGLTTATTYFVRNVAAGVIELYDTFANATATPPTTTGRVDISSAGVGTHTIQRTPLVANTVSDHDYNGRAIIFVDLNEAQRPENRAKGLNNVGWWSYRQVTNADGSIQNLSECLVAMSSTRDTVDATASNTQANTGDQADDSIVVDGTITIDTQPVAISRVAPATGSFTVAATIAGAGTLTYQWQVAESTAPTTWTNVSRGSGGTTATYTTGVTAVAASPTGDTNGDRYRCVVSATGSTSVTSSVAVLTVTAS